MSVPCSRLHSTFLHLLENGYIVAPFAQVDLTSSRVSVQFHPSIFQQLHPVAGAEPPGAGDVDLQMLFSLPLIKLAAFGVLPEEQVDALVEQINQAVRSESD